MISHLDLSYFKCFERLKLPLNRLTLLSGTNSSGKSSILQALVLLHQTMTEHEWSTRLMLNGGSLRMGIVSDVVDQVNGKNTIEISVTNDDNSCSWVFTGGRGDMSMSVGSIEVSGLRIDRPTKLRYLLPEPFDETCNSLTNTLRRMTYLTAERIGPREIYSLEDPRAARVVGPKGEDIVSLLHWGSENRVIECLYLPEEPNILPKQVGLRMQRFFPGFALALQAVPQANAVTLGLRTAEGTSFQRPTNVGFGITQVLPIVTAALSAEIEDILLVENPEVHLHPAGQSLIGSFLCEVAQAGVQVILETHSDHVLNGIRRSVKENTIAKENVALYYMRQRDVEDPQVSNPIIDENGNVDFWPRGFFDQVDIDANYFAGWGK